jgi:phosphoheptose isomerase
VSSRSPVESRGQDDPVAEHFRRSCETLSRAADDPDLRAKIYEIAETIGVAFRAGHKLLIAGNGGSAADAQHIAGEFLSRLNFDRKSTACSRVDHRQFGLDRDRQRLWL